MLEFTTSTPPADSIFHSRLFQVAREHTRSRIHLGNGLYYVGGGWLDFYRHHFLTLCPHIGIFYAKVLMGLMHEASYSNGSWGRDVAMANSFFYKIPALVELF